MTSTKALAKEQLQGKQMQEQMKQEDSSKIKQLLDLFAKCGYQSMHGAQMHGIRPATYEIVVDERLATCANDKEFVATMEHVLDTEVLGNNQTLNVVDSISRKVIVEYTKAGNLKKIS